MFHLFQGAELKQTDLLFLVYLGAECSFFLSEDGHDVGTYL